MIHRGAFPVLAAALLLAPAAAGAVTKIEGEYQLMLDARNAVFGDGTLVREENGQIRLGGSQRAFAWDWDSNNNDSWTGAQVRMFSQPRPNVEAFLKFEADFHDFINNSERPVFQYREAHLRYRWDLQKRGVDTYLFSRQERFWVDNYLIRVIENEQLKADEFGPNAQGLRMDTWGFLGLNTSFYASDYSNQFNPASTNPAPDVMRTDDAYVARVRREFFRDRTLRLGLTYNRKVETRIADGADVRLGHADGRYRWRGVDFSLEYAESRSPIGGRNVLFQDALDQPVTLFRRSTGLHLPDRSALMAEIRTISFGRPRYGYVNIVPTYWRRGPLYENRLGDLFRDENGQSRQRDNVGFNLNAWYLLPERAITLTSNHRRYSSRAFERRSFDEFYQEIYVEFVNGFTGKSYLRFRDTKTDFGGFETLEEHDDWFTELQVENRLAWMRFQTKARELGKPWRQELFSIEARINLTERLKSYNRFTFANDPAELRKGLFVQLQYRPTYNMEMFLEYGPGWIGDSNNPVDDFDLEGGADQVDLVKFILKGWF